MVEILKVVILGAVQGISEFLPISSTGHLILAEHFLGISQNTFGLAFDAALHLGTLLSILWFFRKEFLEILISGYRYIPDKINHKQAKKPILLFLLVATIPAVIFGLLLENLIDTVFRSPAIVGLMLILFSFVLLYAEKFGQQTKTLKKLNIIDSIIIGFGQAVALIPGVSRSGITMAAGMQRKLTRSEAARFAFILSAPVVAGAGGKQFIDTIQLYLNQQIPADIIGFFLIGMVSSAIMGYLTIKYFLKYISRHTLYPFIIYRIILGLAVISL